jgi:hypothetical protein|tara:strand:+ start:629 stop:1087 length:459 start_codon:yes stop_codon:yes gene_type:complete
MALPKLPVKDILAAIDMGAKNIWDEISDDERKSVSFWLLNRYVSSVKGNREEQELAVFKTNEYYNKNYNMVSKHPKLQWQLLCQAGNTQKIQFHQWIGFKKKSGSSDANGIKLLSQIFPNMKTLEVEMLAGMYTKKELKALAEEYNIEGIKF